MARYEIALDVAKGPRFGEPVRARVGDRGSCEVVAEIFDHGDPLPLDGWQARFECVKPDGTYVRDTACQVSGAKVEYALAEQACAAPGLIAVAYFALLHGGEVVESTQSFAVVVEPDALSAGGGLSEDYINEADALIEMLEEASARYDAAERARAEAEDAREAAEAAREAAEAERAAAEAARKVAEDGRASAESARQGAEAARASAEDARAEAEAARAASEAARAAAEAGRESSEEAREAAEDRRAEAEEARESAEAARASAEQGRDAAERSRESAESQRAEAEDFRESAESQRAAAESQRSSAEEARAADEAARAEAEDTRASSENAREAAESARAEAEAARASAESQRAAAESGREAAETSREASEQGRDAAERSRESAESQRAEAEDFRESAESQRAAAEMARATAEDARATAEDARASAESSREGAEAARARAEEARVEAEAARAASEGVRAAAESSREDAEVERERRQDKNDADQAANNLAAQGIVAVVLEAGQYDPDTLEPTVEGANGKIYLVPNPKGSERDSYAEWVWLPGKGGFEALGAIGGIDLIADGEIDAVAAGEAPTGDKVLGLAGLAHLWAKIKGAFAALSHKHAKADISDFPTSMPASDVPAWAKEPQKPSYTPSEVGAAPASHGHEVADVEGLQASLDGKAAKSHAHTPSEVGAAPESHTHDLSEIDHLQVTATEVNSLYGVDGNIQQQLWEKAERLHKHSAADVEGLQDIYLEKAGVRPLTNSEIDSVTEA